MDIYKHIFFPSDISYESAIGFIRFSDMTMDNTEKHCDYSDLTDSSVHLSGHSVCTKKQKTVNGLGTAAKLFLCLIFFGLS